MRPSMSSFCKVRSGLVRSPLMMASTAQRVRRGRLKLAGITWPAPRVAIAVLAQHLVAHAHRVGVDDLRPTKRARGPRSTR